jgi:hypothetical protein
VWVVRKSTYVTQRVEICMHITSTQYCNRTTTKPVDGNAQGEGVKVLARRFHHCTAPMRHQTWGVKLSRPETEAVISRQIYALRPYFVVANGVFLESAIADIRHGGLSQEKIASPCQPCRSQALLERRRAVQYRPCITVMDALTPIARDTAACKIYR